MLIRIEVEIVIDNLNLEEDREVIKECVYKYLEELIADDSLAYDIIEPE